MKWEEAIEEAKIELGIDGYTDDWDEVINLARDIFEEQEENFETNKKENQEDYKEYLKSEWWQSLRLQALKRDNYICVKCKNVKATEVHHTRYDHNETPWEIHCIISLCGKCHESEGRKQTIFK